MIVQRFLDWAPTAPLKEGLRHTIAYFDKLMSEGGAARQGESASPRAAA